MQETRDMQLFVWVVEQGNFAGAAKQAKLSPAMVGRRIAALERDLGFRLVNRTTRRMHITPGGQSYYTGCTQLLEQIRSLEESVSSAHQSNPRGLVRMSAPDGLGSPFLMDAIKRFRAIYPAIRFEVSLTNQPLDLLGTQTDLAFRLSYELQDSSLVARKLRETRFALYGSHTYTEKHGQPTNIAELSEHQCVTMSNGRYGGDWTVLVEEKRVKLRQPWALSVTNTPALLHAIVEGVGIGVVPALLVAQHPRSDEFVELPMQEAFPIVGLYLLYPSRRHLPHRVQLFLDFVLASPQV